MILLVILVLVLILDVASWLWGFDSTDGLTSSEWERRRVHALNHRSEER